MKINQKLDNNRGTIIVTRVVQIKEQYNKSKSLIELCFQGVFERELL